MDGKDFVVVPYTLRNNDILLIEGRNFTPGQFFEQIKLDFDQLFEEGAVRRRMMSISAHDRISGTPAMVRVWGEFLRYAKSHPDVAFMRKDDIANVCSKPYHNTARKRNNLVGLSDSVGVARSSNPSAYAATK